MPQYFNFALNKTSIYYDDGVNYNIAAAPLYFVRSGYVYLPNTAGTLRYAGLDGHWWSSRSDSTTTNAYGLYFNASDVNPSRRPLAWFPPPLPEYCTRDVRRGMMSNILISTGNYSQNKKISEKTHLLSLWRKREDSNLRDIAAHTISSRAPSTTRPRFHYTLYHSLW